MAGSNLQALAFFGSDMSSGDVFSDNFFEPDIMLPEQFNGSDEFGLNGGERKLMAAILSDGIEAFMEQAQGIIKGISAKHDAIDWVECDDCSYVFSFDNVCSSLGINANYLRFGLARYIQSIKKARKNILQSATTANSGSTSVEPVTWTKIRRPRTRG